MAKGSQKLEQSWRERERRRIKDDENIERVCFLCEIPKTQDECPYCISDPFATLHLTYGLYLTVVHEKANAGLVWIEFNLTVEGGDEFVSGVGGKGESLGE